MASSKGSLTGHIHDSGVAEDSQTEIYNKRKALELLKSGSPKGQLSRQGSKEHGHVLSGTSGDFPQKKQKLVPPQYRSDFDRVSEEEYDLIVNKKNCGEFMQCSDSGGSTGGSLHGSESSAVDSDDCSEPSLTNDSRSPRSIASSRSSSRPPDFETQSDALLCDLSRSIYDAQFQLMSDEDATPVKTLAKNPLVTDQTIPRPLTYSVKVETGNTTPTISFERNPAEFEVLEDIHTPRENEYPDQSSFTRSASPSNRSHPGASSFSGSEDPSTEGDRSSQSQPSSVVSDSVTSDDSSDGDYGGTLQGVLRTVLRTDPDVAEILFRALDGKLECAPPNHSDQFEESSGLDLLRILDLQDSSIFQNSGVLTTRGPTSSSGSSSGSSSTDHQGGAIQPQSNGSSLGPGGTPVGRGSAPPKENSGQLVRSQRNNARSNSPQSAKPHCFRCIHNALAPEIFCVNHVTQERFRPCAGPGWNSIQHLKEHMQSHHTKKPNLLQCTRCQEEFENQDLLKSHEMNVDCPIRCPDCREEFEKKAMRQAHQEERHLEETKESRFMEIDDAMDKKIKESLKSYVDSLKKGKGPIDPTLDQWIEANTDRYMIGRSSKRNPKLELGQWYIIFSTLASETRVLEHPFYDYGLSPSDLAGEKILLINESMIDARIEIHGPPPTELQPQRDWYQDVLRESLKVAAKTRLVPQAKMEESSEQQDISNSSIESSYPQEPSASGVEGTGYNLPLITGTHDMTPGFQMIAPHGSQVASMSSHVPGLALPPSNFLRNDQQQTSLMTGISSELAGETSVASGMMTEQMPDLDTWDFPPNMTDARGQPFSPQGNFEFPEDYDVPFETSGSDLLGHSQFQFWPRQQGKRWRRE